MDILIRRGFLLLLLLASSAQASHHNWRVVEVYTNDDGTLQFIQMASTNANERNLSCCVFTSSNTATGESISYRFPSNLAGDSLNRQLLLGTSAIESTYGIRPDYIIPDNFLFPTTGGIQYNEPVVWDQLPINGVDSLNIVSGQQQIAPATITNYDGATVTLPVDRTPPVITVPAPLTIDSNSAVASTDSRITAFVADITCSDDIDTAPVLEVDVPATLPIGTTTLLVSCTDAEGNETAASARITVETFDDNDNDGIANADDPDDDNDGVPDETDAFPLDASETRDTDDDGIGDNADTDDDGDGTPDTTDAFPLDPTESVDTDGDGIGNNADTDDDGDGISDADEDNEAPVISGTETIRVDATGRLTAVDLSGVTATDNNDGEIVPAADRTGPFASGRHVLTWTARDSAGNEATAEQVIEIRPIVFVQQDQIVAEGAATTIAIALSGDAPDYPVLIETSVGGTADAGDYSAELAPIAITGGTAGEVTITTFADAAGEGDETIEITFTEGGNAVVRPDTRHRITITEANVPPRGTLRVSQSGRPGTTVYRDSGAVMIEADVTDQNVDQNLAFDWSGSSPELGGNGVQSAKLSFDATILAAGQYEASVIVSDGETSIALARQIFVEDAAPALTSADTDGDGESDAAEGTADIDGDGIPDWRDSDDNPRFLPTSGDGDFMETGAGIRLRLGRLAIAEGNDTAAINAAALPRDAGFRAVGPRFDFEASGVTSGDPRAWVVLPLGEQIPAGAAWRKYSDISGWGAFIADDRNTIASAAPIAGLCPPPRDDRWQSGLTTGDACVRLWLEDGGPNDTDGSKNGHIIDPGGLSIPDAAPLLKVPSASSLEATSADGINLDAVSDILAGASCTDSVDGELEVEVSGTQDPLPLGDTEIRFACTDSAANEVTATVTLSVVDTTPPDITIGSPLSVTSESAVSATDGRVVSFISAVSCADAVSTEPALTNDLPTSLPTGATTVTFECEDDAGNVATEQTTITVTLPAALAEQSDEGAGCFIATAAYGSALDPHVDSLREFRDHALLWHAPGRYLIDRYYRYSPPIADAIAASPWLRAAVRGVLTPVILAIAWPLTSLTLLMLLLAGLRYRRSR